MTPGTTLTHASLVPVETTQDVIASIYGQSALLQQVDTQPMSGLIEENVTVDQAALAASIPMAGANVAELGEKPAITGAPPFPSSQMVARKMAVTMVISDELKTYSVIDIFDFYRNAIEQKFAFWIDYYGMNGGAWAGSEGILPAVELLPAASGHVVPETADFFQDSSDMLSAIEEDGRNPSGFIFDIRKRRSARDARDADGRPLYQQSFAEDIPPSLHGLATNFLGDGVFTVAPDAVRGVAGDFQRAMRIGILEQITADIATTGEVDGINLFVENAAALRVEMKLGSKVKDARALAVLRQPATP